MPALKIISYNVHKGFNAVNRLFVLPEIRQALQAIDPDIVFLQEVQGKHKKRHLKKILSPEIPQTEFLAESHWPYYIYGKNAIYGMAHHGNALLSKFPFNKWDNINVALSARASRSLLHGIINLDQTQIHVICIHLGLFKAERNIQLTLLSDRIKAFIPHEAPLIIAGDFNDWQSLAENHLEMELGLKEVYKEFHGEHAKTFPTTRPTIRVDRIYYRGFGLKQTLVLSSEPWNKLSESFAALCRANVMMRLKWRLFLSTPKCRDKNNVGRLYADNIKNGGDIYQCRNVGIKNNVGRLHADNIKNGGDIINAEMSG